MDSLGRSIRPNENSGFGSRYTLLGLLGSGASGDVYEAVDSLSESRVAVKVLKGALAEDQELVRRFVQERSLLARVEHPNVVRVHDLILDGGRLGIVMELVPGGNLRERIERGPLPAQHAVGLAGGVAAGLAAIHRCGVVHRDLKPENILLFAEAGEVVPKVTDFGIARLTGSALTKSSAVLGTPLYVAPEVANRQGSGSPTDVYALGVIIFELLVGAPPFDGDTPMELLTAHLTAPPPNLAGVPADFAALVHRMLAKEPNERPTAEEVAAALADVDDSEGSGWRPALSSGVADHLSPAPLGRTIVRSEEGVGGAKLGSDPMVDADVGGSGLRQRLLYAGLAGLALLGLGGILVSLDRTGDASEETVEQPTLAEGGLLPVSTISSGAETLDEKIDRLDRSFAGSPTADAEAELIAALLERAESEGSPRQARADYERVLELNPRATAGMAGLAEIAAADGRFDEALALLQAAVAEGADDTVAAQLSQVYAELGEEAKRDERFNEADELFSQAVEADPANDDAWARRAHNRFQLGAIPFRSGDYAAANVFWNLVVDDATTAIQLNPENRSAYHARAEAGFNLQTDEALQQSLLDYQYLAETEEGDRFYVEARLGEAFYQVGRYEDALEHYRRALVHPTSDAGLKTAVEAKVEELQGS